MRISRNTSAGSARRFAIIGVAVVVLVRGGGQEDGVFIWGSPSCTYPDAYALDRFRPRQQATPPAATDLKK